MTIKKIYNELQLIQEFESNFYITNESETRRKELLKMLDTLNK